MNTPRYTVLGINDESTTCDCCGKTGLKKTVVLEHAGDGAISRMGVDCASDAMRIAPAKVKRIAEQKQSDADRNRAMLAERIARVNQLMAMRAAGEVKTEAGQNIFDVLRVLTASLRTDGIEVGA